MKPEEKRNIFILIVIVVIVIVILAIIKGKKPKNNNEDVAYYDKEQTVVKLESGTKLNISEKLAEKKYFLDFEVSNIQLTEKDEKTKLVADVKNTSANRTEITSVQITFYNKEGEELTTVKDALIANIEPGEKTKLNISTTSNCVDAYDFSIRIAEGGGV